jgi:hypothetical protein
MYEAFLFRQADATGFIGLSNAIQYGGLQAIVDGGRNIAFSLEYAQAVVPAHQPYQIIENIYRVFFNRIPDPGAATYVTLLAEGQAMVVFQSILGSQEFAYNFLR